MQENIEIPLSKKKLVLLLAGSLVFVAAGIWFLINPPKINNALFGNPTFILIISIAAILFFGTIAVLIARKLPENKPGLIIDSVGLTDNSGGISAGQILWSDLQNISVIEINRQKIILLEVKNPQDYINRQTSGLKRKLMQLNYNSYGTPLSISSNSLQIEFNELVTLLNNRLMAIKG
ncbi:hypothetical protein L0U88_01410 [Flavihumibacter sp. RY-1]|uniref:Uncharacterized protein n=1 Tax=Flavihumibacter fluminis TaxID=2909236 RepID=A0ABS9BCP2_9BACT|nr:STM3941 family protein [Flavihumibacter fluminis]MCF1713282.1 hypothetical protein [Flavihumibacter fluminis]